MAQVVKTDTDSLNSVLTVTITPEDYLGKVETELSNYRKKAEIKGFRKGKAPKSFLRKMYGRSVLADTINKILQDNLASFIEEEKLNILGQPLPSENHEPINFDLSKKQDYVFNFDIGLFPKTDVKGFDAVYDYYKVEASKEKAESIIEDVRNQAGERESVDTAIEENDMLSINAEELGEDGKVKENGWANTFSVLVKDLDEKYRSELLGKKKGDKFTFNPYEIESGKTKEYVDKYLLEIKEEDEVTVGESFEGAIADVLRMVPAELNQEFWDKIFPKEENITSKEEAIENIMKTIEGNFTTQADNLLFFDLREKLLEANQVELPEAFLKRSMKTNNEELTDEAIEGQIEAVKSDIRWSLIAEDVKRENTLEVTGEMIADYFKNQIRSYMRGFGDEAMIESTAQNLMQDQKQVRRAYDELMSLEVFKTIKGKVALNEIVITEEELNEKLKARQPQQPEAAAAE